MLVLGRRQNESIIINDDIEITVVRIDGGQVKLAFSAPEKVKIWRKEIYDRMRTERKVSNG